MREITEDLAALVRGVQEVGGVVPERHSRLALVAHRRATAHRRTGPACRAARPRRGRLHRCGGLGRGTADAAPSGRAVGTVAASPPLNPRAAPVAPAAAPPLPAGPAAAASSGAAADGTSARPPASDAALDAEPIACITGEVTDVASCINGFIACVSVPSAERDVTPTGAPALVTAAAWAANVPWVSAMTSLVDVTASAAAAIAAATPQGR